MTRLKTLVALAHLLSAALGQPEPIFGPIATGLSHPAGTAASISPDGTTVFVTAADGTLGAFDATSGEELWRSKPVGAVKCASGVTFSPDGSSLVYAVWLDDAGTTSRVISVPLSSTDGASLWESADIAGGIAGAPVYGRNSEYVYFTHNTDEGHFTVLKIEDNTPSLYFNASLTDLEGISAVGGDRGVNRTLITAAPTWSPLAIAFDPKRVDEDEITGPSIVNGGNHRFGRDNMNDLLIWGHQHVDGSTSYDGYYYAFQLPDLATNPLKVYVLDFAQWATTRKPVLSANGLDMFISASRGLGRGWTKTEFQQGANVKVGAKTQQRDGPNPSLSTPSLTPDATKAFFASTNRGFYGVSMTPDNRDFLWNKTNLPATVIAGSQTSPDNQLVYVFLSNGAAHAFDAANGNEAWAQSAGAAGVEADFSLTSDGSKLYFVDVSGGMSGWTVGTTAVTTDSPTTSPTLMPTMMKTPEPAPIETTSPTSMATMSPTMAPAEGTEAPTEKAEPVVTDQPTVAPTDGGMATMEPTDGEMATMEPTDGEMATMEPGDGEMATMEPTDGEMATTEPTDGEMATTAPTPAPTDKPTDPRLPVPPTEMPTPEPTDPQSVAAKVSTGIALLLGAVWVVGTMFF